MATDVLRGALNTDAKSPVERFGGVLTGGSIRERGKEAREAMPTIMQESAQAAGQAKRAELEATNQQLGREVAVEEQAATKLRTETERIRGLEQPYQEFKAPEYTAADYAKGAAKRALVGVLLGGIAKTSALTQLKAIKAMQDAERDGRTQDFEAARLNFDEAEKKRADFNKRLQTELSDFQQLLGKDTAAAKLKAKMMTAQMMDGLASAAERNQNYRQFMEILTNATNQSNELEVEAFKQQGRLREAEAKAAAKAEQPGRAGQYALTYASRVYGNIQNAYQDLENIQNLPAIAQSPVLSGMINRDPETAFSSLTALVGRKVTEREARAFDQVANSLSAALARLEAQGLASGGTKANISAFDALKPRAGDDAINMALYIARVKQEIQVGINVHEKMPGATPEQKQEAKQILTQLDRVVPFDTQDVMETLRGSNQPMSQKMNQLVRKPFVAEQIKPESEMQQESANAGFDETKRNRLEELRKKRDDGTLGR